MFHSARIQLTLWYLLIIMSISVCFSVVLYTGISNELQRSLRMQQFRIYRQNRVLIVQPDQPMPSADVQLLSEEEDRVRLILVLVNLGILIVAGGAGYFLAGQTLRPIKQMVDEQNRFITDASHELRTPLTALRSEIEVNLRDKGLNLSDARKLLQSNLEEVENLQLLSDSLLQLTHFPKTNGSFALEKISLQEVIDEAIKKVTVLAKKKQMMLEVKVGNLFSLGEKQSLLQLFVILLDNAIKYSSKKKTVWISATLTDHTIHIFVKDEGMGIDKKDLPHIFDRFYRADFSRSKQQIAGYGLGLSIAQQIVTTHKGTISVKSDKDKGTVFTVTLPSIG